MKCLTLKKSWTPKKSWCQHVWAAAQVLAGLPEQGHQKRNAASLAQLFGEAGERKAKRGKASSACLQSHEPAKPDAQALASFKFDFTALCN